MQAEVILGHEAGAAHYFVYLRMFAGDYADARADGAAVGFCAYALDFEPVAFGAAIVAQKCGRLVHVDNGDVDVSIVVEIAEGGASAAVRLSHGGPACGADVDEAPLAKIFVQNLSFLEGDVEPARIDFGKHMAVGHEDVGPAIVVEIEETYSPSEILGVYAQAGLKDGVVEGAVAIVVVQVRGLVGVVGLDDIEPAITVVIADADAHAALRRAIFIEGAADFRADFSEGAILVVAIDTAGYGVAGDVNVGPAVVVEVGRRDTETVRTDGSPLIVDE